MRGAVRYALRRLILVILVLALLPSLLLLLYRWVDPPTTPLIVMNRLDGTTITRSWRPLDEIALPLRYAVIAGEDNFFCTHHGFDWTELRGQIDLLLAGERPRGASTITMQTAKNALLWNSRSFMRKIIEAWFTPQIELFWSKHRILEVYLNIIEFGPGIFGAEAAARHFFDKPAADLTSHEAARLAAILPAPHLWSPTQPSPRVLRRTSIIETRIKQLGDRLLACAR